MCRCFFGPSYIAMAKIPDMGASIIVSGSCEAGRTLLQMAEQFGPGEVEADLICVRPEVD